MLDRYNSGKDFFVEIAKLSIAFLHLLNYTIILNIQGYGNSKQEPFKR